MLLKGELVKAKERSLTQAEKEQIEVQKMIEHMEEAAQERYFVVCVATVYILDVSIATY